MQDHHGNQTLICPDCNYQTPRKDNLRHHLKTAHKYVQVRDKLDSVDTVCKSKKKQDAGKAPVKSKKNIIKTKLKPMTSDQDYIYKQILANKKPYQWAKEQFREKRSTKVKSMTKQFTTKPVTTPPK